MKTCYTNKLVLLLLLLASSFLMSCKDDEGGGDQVLLPKLDGLYVFGTNTVAESPSSQNAKMALAVLDTTKASGVESMDGVFGKLIHIGANSKINFAIVTNGEGVVYGADDGGSVDSASVVGGAVKDLVIHGAMIIDGMGIDVAEAGLYYVFVNTNDETFILTRIRLDMIGDATELQWSAGTPLPLKSSSVDSTVFEGTGIVLKDGGGYRYRYNDGWHLYQDQDIVTLSSLGVPDFNKAKENNNANIGYYHPNIPQVGGGIYTVRMKYTFSTGEWKETKIKTGNVLIDYTDTQLGLFGNAYYNAEGDTAAWGDGDDFGLKAPVKYGYVYTWTWEGIDLFEGRQFILRQDAGWAGLIIAYDGVAPSGEAFDNGSVVDATTQEQPDHNFYVVNGGKYDITFVIDAETTGRSLMIEPSE